MDKILLDEVEVKRLDKKFGCKSKLLACKTKVNVTTFNLTRENWILELNQGAVVILHESNSKGGKIHFHEQRKVSNLYQAYDSINAHIKSKALRRLHHMNKMFEQIKEN